MGTIDGSNAKAMTMTRTSLSANRIIRIVAASLFFAAAPAFGRAKASVTFTSPCTCEGNHGVARWAAKTDKEQPPLNPAAIQPITPADICRWEGPGERIGNSGRLPAEQKWYAVECRIAAVKVEDDGDLHIEVQNSDGRGDRVVVEVPLGDTWCEIRKAAFAWTDAKFPLTRGQFKTVQHPTVTVIGKAFYDVDHARRRHAEQSTRSKRASCRLGNSSRDGVEDWRSNRRVISIVNRTELNEYSSDYACSNSVRRCVADTTQRAVRYDHATYHD